MKSSATRVVLILAVLLLAVPAGPGCAPATRYRVLSFFFDGVPPPEGTEAPATTDASERSPLSASKVVISKHQPYAKKECTGCHSPMTNTLIAPVPELCFKCHKMGLKEKRYVHGPALAGFCRLCHDPHLSRYPSLLLAAPRQMCFYCHNPEDVAKTEVHADDQAPCTKCHNPHADNRYFLRDDAAGTAPQAAPAPPATGEAPAGR